MQLHAVGNARREVHLSSSSSSSSIAGSRREDAPIKLTESRGAASPESNSAKPAPVAVIEEVLAPAAEDEASQQKTKTKTKKQIIKKHSSKEGMEMKQATEGAKKELKNDIGFEKETLKNVIGFKEEIELTQKSLGAQCEIPGRDSSSSSGGGGTTATASDVLALTVEGEATQQNTERNKQMKKQSIAGMAEAVTRNASLDEPITVRIYGHPQDPRNLAREDSADGQLVVAMEKTWCPWFYENIHRPLRERIEVRQLLNKKIVVSTVFIFIVFISGTIEAFELARSAAVYQADVDPECYLYVFNFEDDDSEYTFGMPRGESKIFSIGTSIGLSGSAQVGSEGFGYKMSTEPNISKFDNNHSESWERHVSASTKQTALKLDNFYAGERSLLTQSCILIEKGFSHSADALHIFPPSDTGEMWKTTPEERQHM